MTNEPSVISQQVGVSPIRMVSSSRSSFAACSLKGASFSACVLEGSLRRKPTSEPLSWGASLLQQTRDDTWELIQMVNKS